MHIQHQLYLCVFIATPSDAMMVELIAVNGQGWVSNHYGSITRGHIILGITSYWFIFVILGFLQHLPRTVSIQWPRLLTSYTEFHRWPRLCLSFFSRFSDWPLASIFGLCTLLDIVKSFIRYRWPTQLSFCTHIMDKTFWSSKISYKCLLYLMRHSRCAWI